MMRRKEGGREGLHRQLNVNKVYSGRDVEVNRRYGGKCMCGLSCSGGGEETSGDEEKEMEEEGKEYGAYNSWIGIRNKTRNKNR